MNKLPNWVRWILFAIVPCISALVVAVVGPFILALLGWIPADSQSPLLPVFQALLVSFALGYIGYSIAPTHKFGFGIIQPIIYGTVQLGVIVLFAAGLIILGEPLNLGKHLYMLGPVAGVAASTACCLMLHREHKNNKDADTSAKQSTSPVE